MGGHKKNITDDKMVFKRLSTNMLIWSKFTFWIFEFYIDAKSEYSATVDSTCVEFVFYNPLS